MRRYLFILASVAILSVNLQVQAQEYSWEYVPIDGDMTGCTAPTKDNVSEAVGTFKRGKYIAPNGKVYKRNSSVAKTAKVVLEAQPKMARVKEVVGYSTRAMSAQRPESALSNWFVDLLMEETEKLAGKPVHIGVTNFRGIRVDMPQGEVLLDDMLSMFPFKNYLVYVEHTGKQIRTILEEMASRYFEVLGGVRVVADAGKLVSVEIDGEPLDDEKVYGMATISFLLEGGGHLTLAHNALSVTIFEDVPIIDAVLEHLKSLSAAGKPIEYDTDGRVLINNPIRR